MRHSTNTSEHFQVVLLLECCCKRKTWLLSFFLRIAATSHTIYLCPVVGKIALWNQCLQGTQMASLFSWQLYVKAKKLVYQFKHCLSVKTATGIWDRSLLAVLAEEVKQVVYWSLSWLKILGSSCLFVKVTLNETWTFFFLFVFFMVKRAQC